MRATGSVTLNTNGPNADVKIGDQMLHIAKSRLLLDGEPLADLPADTRKVDVEVQEGRLLVTVDGKHIIEKPLAPSDHNSAHAPAAARNDAAAARIDAERAQRQADRARNDADRARSEGDRLREDAERIREEAERLRQQADRLRNQ